MKPTLPRSHRNQSTRPAAADGDDCDQTGHRFAHGLWADGSCFSKLIPTLLAEGYEVMASQHGLDSVATDVAAVKACLARVQRRSTQTSLVALGWAAAVQSAAAKRAD